MEIGWFNMYRKNNVIYVDFLFKRKKIKSKFMVLLYSFYTKIRKHFLKPFTRKFYKYHSMSNDRQSSNY